MTETKETKRDIISPEGVEERLIQEFTFYITLTGGGKYRTYQKSNDKSTSLAVHNTLEEAEKALASGMMIFGGLKVCPDKVLDIMLGPKKETP